MSFVTGVPRNAKTKAASSRQLDPSSSRPTFLCCLFLFPQDSQNLLTFPPLFGYIYHLLWLFLRSRNLLICWSLCPSSIPAQYVSIVLDIHALCPTPSQLSMTPKFVWSWQRDLCTPRMKRDPRSLPFWYCLASIMNCIVRSTRALPAMCILFATVFFPLASFDSVLSQLAKIFFYWAQMSRFPSPFSFICTTRLYHTSCVVQPTCLSLTW